MGLTIAGSALAQTTEVGRGTLKEFPTELQPVPHNFRGFRLMPAVTVTTAYDNNIYADASNEVDDVITTIKPQISISKEYKSLSLALNSSAEYIRYLDFSEENKANYFGNFSGNYVLNSKWKFPFGITYSQRFRDRSSPLAVASRTDKPVRTYYTDFSAGAIRTFNRLSIGLIGTYSELSLENGISESNPSNSIIFSDNDHSLKEGRLEFTYDLLRGDSASDAPEHFLYATLRAGEQDYQRRSWTGSDFSGLRRDRNIYGALFGFQTNYKNLINARLGAGFIQQNFKEDSIETTRNMDFEADIEYLIRPKLLLGFIAGRDIRQDNDLLQGLVESSYQFNAEYELKHDLYLNGGIGYVTNEFLGNLDRTDNDMTARIGLDYILNPMFRLSSEFSYLTRDSSNSNNNLDKSVISVRLKTNF